VPTVRVLRPGFALQAFAVQLDQLYTIFSLTVPSVLFLGLTGTLR